MIYFPESKELVLELSIVASQINIKAVVHAFPVITVIWKYVLAYNTTSITTRNLITYVLLTLFVGNVCNRHLNASIYIALNKIADNRKIS